MSQDLRLKDLRQIARTFKPKIDAVYSGKAANTEETVILKEIIGFLQKIPKDVHLFCDADFNPIAVFSLVIFSFRVSSTIKYVTDILDVQLAECKECVLGFVRGKCKILQHFSSQRLVAHQHVTEFGDMVDKWRIESILPVFTKISSDSSGELLITKDLKIAFYECLCNPRMLRLNVDLKGAVDAIFAYLLSINSTLLDLNLNEMDSFEFLSGILYCWYSGTTEQVRWSKEILLALHDMNFKLTASKISPDLIEEISFYYLSMQNPRNWIGIKISAFWLKLTPIFAFFEKNVFIEYFEVPKNIRSLKQSFEFPIESLFKLWYNHLASLYQDKPMAILLRALSFFLELFKNDFWLKIEPYTFHSVLDTIFAKDSFEIALKKVENYPDEELNSLLIENGTLSDMVTWTIPFYHSVSDTKKMQMIKKVSMIFLKHIANRTSKQGLTNACFLNSSTALLRYALVIKEDERDLLFAKNDFETVLYTKIDFRAFINIPLIQDVFIRTITDPSDLYPNLGEYASTLAVSAMQVVTKCISLDILLLCHYSYELYSERTTQDSSSPLTLFQNLTSRLDLSSFRNGPVLTKNLLASLRDINGLILISNNSPRTQTHNTKVKEFLHLATKMLEKCTDVLPNQMSNVLSDPESAQGYWSCVFSSNTELYQAATNILYDTFDVEGRLEGIQTLMKKNPAHQIKAINMVLSTLIKCQFYAPCPRAVRVLMDVLTSFNDPASGFFSIFSDVDGGKAIRELQDFWQLTWKFLDTIYKCTLWWASKYDYSELENFTKDTLDLSRTLVDSYRGFSEILGKNSDIMFDSVLSALKNMLYWLRLSDEALLESCVCLIVSTSDLARENNIVFSDTLVETMAKYALKAKKYSNKLTELQSNEILSKASAFNSFLTDMVRKSVESHKKEKELSKVNTKNSSRSTSSSIPPESKIEFLQRKAVASSITGKPKVSQSKITSFGTIQHGGLIPMKAKSVTPPLSKMELARRQLNSTRVVHPPSTSVFNTKKVPTAQSEVNSSSEESEADIESARELFALSKSKGKSIQTIDLKGRPVVTQSAADVAKRNEEYMRKRLNVDLNPLYSTVLQWNYNRRNDYPEDEKLEKYTVVKDSFQNATDYQKTMRPLLFLESWQGLCSARDREDNKPYSMIIGNRTAVSDFYEIYASVRKKQFLECKISDSDLIVVTYLPNLKSGQNVSSNEFKQSEITCLAKIKSLKKTKGETVDLTMRIHRNHPFAKLITLRSELHAVKVMQMTTIEREFSTLEGLAYYDMLDQILRAKPCSPAEVSEKEISMVQKNYQLNTSQAEAIVHSIANKGFSLIQGPPGTGKTKTVLGVIGYFLSTANTPSSNIIKAPVEFPTNSNGSPNDIQLKKQKLLICAPSNAAVDELVLRLKEGVYNMNGQLFKPQLVRIGRSDAVNPAIKNLTLEELVDQQVAQKNYEFSTNPDLEKKFATCVVKRRELRSKLDEENGSLNSALSTEDISKLQLEIRELSKEINDLARQRDQVREQNSINYRNRDLDRRNAQAKILLGSDIICSTLSGSAHDVLATMGVKFDTVIIDEACQCTELSTITPLRYGATQCIMVGDPNQLPPTVLSSAAGGFLYDQSLFVRMAKNTTPYLLNVQYRMNPDISAFPSLEFYKSRLKDGPGMDENTMRPWHSISPLSTYKFFDIAEGQQEQNVRTMSYTNSSESRIAIELIDYLFKNFEAKYDFTGKIGIISPYKEQVMKLKKDFRNHFGSTISAYIDFKTIDGFQGQEKEIIIISCVRASGNSNTGVGFLKDFRRMNVALTRAKCSMWILGHRKSLKRDRLWNHLINNANNRNALELVSSGFLKNSGLKAVKHLGKNKPKSSNTQQNTDNYDPHDLVTNKQRKRKLQENTEREDKKKPKHGHSESKGFESKKKTNKTDSSKARSSELPKESNSKLSSSSSLTAISSAKKKSSSDFSKESNTKLSSSSSLTAVSLAREKNSSELPKDSNTKPSSNSTVNKVSSTKKKSSIFGGPSLTIDYAKAKPYIKDVTSKDTEAKKHKKKHVMFSENITIIPKLEKSKEVENGTDRKISNMEMGRPPRLKSPPPVKTLEDDEDNYELPTNLTKDYSKKEGFSNKNKVHKIAKNKKDSGLRKEDKFLQESELPLSHQPYEYHNGDTNKQSFSHVTSHQETKEEYRDRVESNLTHANNKNADATTSNSIPGVSNSRYQPHTEQPYSHNQNNNSHYNAQHYNPSNYQSHHPNHNRQSPPQTHDANIKPQPLINTQMVVGVNGTLINREESQPLKNVPTAMNPNTQPPYRAARSGFIDSKGYRRSEASTPFIPKKKNRRY